MTKTLDEFRATFATAQRETIDARAAELIAEEMTLRADFAIWPIPPCGCGETGRRAGLKIRFRKECRFDSDHPHHSTLLYIKV